MGSGGATQSSDSTRYTLRLAPDGTVQAKVDCNLAGGHYRLEQRRLAIDITRSTMAACEPGSLDAVFLKDLARTGNLFLRGGRLYMDLRYDSGTMEFGR